MREGVNIAANWCFSVSGDITDVWAASGSVDTDLLAPDQH